MAADRHFLIGDKASGRVVGTYRLLGIQRTRPAGWMTGLGFVTSMTVAMAARQHSSVAENG